MISKATLIVNNVYKINQKIFLNVNTITNGCIKSYGVYNLANKFNIRINNIMTNNILIHPINNIELEIQLIEDYKKINIGDILIPLD